MKYLFSFVAAIILAAMALALYGQPLGLDSWSHYAIAAAGALVAYALISQLSDVVWWLLAAALLAVALSFHWHWPVYVVVAIVAAQLASLAPWGRVQPRSAA